MTAANMGVEVDVPPVSFSFPLRMIVMFVPNADTSGKPLPVLLNRPVWFEPRAWK
jgi:hypothetical protein